MITHEKYAAATGREPEHDDLERSNCPLAGQIGHACCGWDLEYDLPVFAAAPLRLRNSLRAAVSVGLIGLR